MKKNISSSKRFTRMSRAASVSRSVGDQRVSKGWKDGSKMYVGYWLWMVDFGLRRSHVCMPIVSRRSCLFVLERKKKKKEEKKEGKKKGGWVK